MLLVVSAPKAFQRKLVDVADRNTTRQAKIDQPARASASYANQADPNLEDFTTALSLYRQRGHSNTRSSYPGLRGSTRLSHIMQPHLRAGRVFQRIDDQRAVHRTRVGQ